MDTIETKITLINAMRYGNWRTRLSLLISGFGNFSYGQWVKGIMFLATQCLTLLIFFDFGMNYVKNLGTLGTEEFGKKWNESLQMYENSPGDNSMIILLFSVLAIALLVLGLVFQCASVKSSYAAQIDVKRGKKPSDFMTDLRNMFDRNMHTTMLTLPAIGVLVFTVLPIIFMILLAFTNFDKSHQPPGKLFTWIGFEVFRDVFSLSSQNGHTFIRVLIWTLIWAIFATFLNYILGMVVAMMINKKGIRLKSFWRMCFVIAIAVPGFVTLLFMRQMLADTGPVNTILQDMGFDPIQFLTNATNAKITIIVVNLWIGIPYTMLITSGILMNIPSDLYEAARIDGAGPVRQFTSITLPYMLAVTTPYLITQFIANINNFNAIYFLTAGNPKSPDLYQAGTTDLLITWLYKLSVNFHDYNLASVIGIIAFVVSAIISLVTYNIMASAKKEETFK